MTLTDSIDDLVRAGRLDGGTPLARRIMTAFDKIAAKTFRNGALIRHNLTLKGRLAAYNIDDWWRFCLRHVAIRLDDDQEMRAARVTIVAHSSSSPGEARYVV
jgi:hypothetical protein